MINFKELAKLITKHGLWEKPLNQLSQEEILKLDTAFYVAHLEQDKVCGSCHYLGWARLKPACFHPDHASIVPVWAWGLGCDDYLYLCDKEMPNNQLNRVEKVTVDQIKGV